MSFRVNFCLLVWLGLGGDKKDQERKDTGGDTLGRSQEETTQCSSQSDLVTDDKFWHFRKCLNYGSKNQHPWTALWSKGLWEEETPSWPAWEGSPGKCFQPSYTIPSVVVVWSRMGTTCASAVAVSGCLLHCVCRVVCPHGPWLLWELLCSHALELRWVSGTSRAPWGMSRKVCVLEISF